MGISGLPLEDYQHTTWVVIGEFAFMLAGYTLGTDNIMYVIGCLEKIQHALPWFKVKKMALYALS